MRRNTILIILLALLFIPLVTHARVTEIVITKTESPTFGGTEFGKVGQYERLEGIMKCEVDPKHPLNAVIVNIDKAPKNAKGFVEYDVDFVILKPIDMNKGNHKILYDTANRGGMITLGTFNNAPRLPTGTATTESAGNGFLMKAGIHDCVQRMAGLLSEGRYPLIFCRPRKSCTGCSGSINSASACSKE